MSLGSGLRSRLAAVIAPLRTQTREQDEAVAQLERLLAQSHISDLATERISRELSIERASWYSPETYQRLDSDSSTM